MSFTFGIGFKGQLGGGISGNLDIPKQIEGFDNVSSVSCGYDHTAFIKI